MNPAAERWQLIKSLFAQASELPDGARSDFLDRACAEDGSLRDEVASLLAAAEGSESLPDVRAAIAVARGRAVDAHLDAGARQPNDRDAVLQSLLEQALGQQYEIVRPLGQGGMGAVYLARERALERFVAIKVLRAELAEAQEGRERFRREARIAAHLSHPGILPLHTFGEVGGLWYFVMGYVRGVSLAEHLRVEGRLPVHETLRILMELTAALESAHRAGVVHRDIKPANVLLDQESGRAILADFGISKVQGGGDSFTASNAVVGTPSYMSPEQAHRSHDVDERTDIYSLGALAYTMLAGREPFAGMSVGDLTRRRDSADPPSLLSVAPSVPADFAAVVMRCLARDPAMRWPSARALADALARVSGDGTHALPESLRELPTFGPYTLLWAGIWTALALRPFRSLGDRALLLLIALIVPVGLVLHVWNNSGDAVPARELARVAFWPPEWWGMWWPRRLRRPTDLWRRLPPLAKAVRIVLSAFIVAIPATILTREWVQAKDASPEWFLSAQLALILCAAAIVASALAWSMRTGLTWSETLRLLFGATAPSAGWNAPAIARLFAWEADFMQPPDRDSPSDNRRAIDALVARLPVAASRVGAAASTAAQRLVTAISACDAEIATLARDANPGELDRLAVRLAALDGSSRPDGEQAELADLVRRQIDVVQRMRVRSELLSQRRTRAFNLLRGLWTRMGVVRAAAEEQGGSLAVAMEQAQILCDEIALTLDDAAATSHTWDRTDRD